MERFIGLDVHRPSTTCAVIDARGKRVRVAGGHEGGVGAAIPHRHAKALAVADHDICAKLAGRAQQRQGQQVCGDYGQRVGGVGAADKVFII